MPANGRPRGSCYNLRVSTDAFGPLLQAALDRRRKLAADPQTNAYRLINRAADGFPDLAVDRYASVLVAHLYTHGQRSAPPRRLLEALAAETGAETVYIKYRPDQGSVVAESDRKDLAPPQPLIGRAFDEIEAVEKGLRFIIRPGEGLSTGLFPDMRDTRAWVEARSPGRTVLNCFAYTCGFGLAAWRGGAARAVNIDVSRKVLDWGRANAERNGFTPPATDLIFGDVFDWLKRFARKGQTFDLVILDPPSYATTRQSRFSVERDYAGLVALAAPLVAPGGELLACANSHTLPAKSFTAMLEEGLTEAGVTGAQLGPLRHEPAIDFPLAPREQPYLKVCKIQFGVR
jgi:23S rRNA (cytosine1962-C5)-methyltransferase